MEPQRTLRVGTDLVRVSRITSSLESFGEAFLRRSFTEAEIAYATASPVSTAERLAARFAAKEATVKALGLRRLHQTVEHKDTPALRGMLNKIIHMLKIEE